LQDLIVFALPVEFNVCVDLLFDEPCLVAVDEAAGNLQECLKFGAFLCDFEQLEGTLDVYPNCEI
jgi:hypothetical protein